MTDKKKRTLIIVLCILAVIVAVGAIIVSPFGRKATNKPNDTDITEITGDAQNETVAAEALTDTVTDAITEAPSDEISETVSESDTASASVPPATKPSVNPNKNYTLFIDTNTFNYTENNDGSTEIVAKENSSVKMTITPFKGESYRQRCDNAESKHGALDLSESLKIRNQNSAYRSQTGDKDTDVITTVYCIDDDKGGCIEIVYQTPVSATKYAELFETMLSMFKVL